MNLNLGNFDTSAVAITDYKMQTAKLAKVVIAYTGKFNRKTLASALTDQLNQLATPVENSFRQVRAGVAVGFLRANKEVRIPQNEQEIRANYRVMSSTSNILMDNRDRSLWEMREGKGGKFLARHGHEDLSELVEANTSRKMQHIPRLSQITTASAGNGEFAAFVSASGDMDYGFVTGTREDAIRVASATTHLDTVVPKSAVVSSILLNIDPQITKALMKAGLTRDQKTNAIDYWTKLYSYAPEYLKDVIQNVEEGTLI